MLKKRVIIAIAISLTLALGIPLQAQHLKKRIRENAGRANSGQTQTKQKTAEPVAVPYLSGEIKIPVKGGDHPVIRIGMAASGVSVIEFPASDRFFAVHPPENGDWVQVEKSPSMMSDHHLVLRAGKDLMNAPGPAASISIQMRSGLIVTIWVYPVKMVVQQTHRCVISYNRAEIVAARRQLGLAVNLGENEEGESAPKITNSDATAKPAATAQLSAPTPAPPSRSESEKPTTSEGANAPEQRPEAPAPARADQKLKVIRSLLNDAVADSKRFKKWTSAANGLSVSTRLAELDEATRVYLVAVKNVENETLRLLPGHPDLIIESLDDKGKVIQLAPIKQLYCESTTSNNVIPAKATIYFAVAYKQPVLGKRQRICVTVGQMNAADDPVITGLTAKQ
jgi:hypothetical protein